MKRLPWLGLLWISLATAHLAGATYSAVWVARSGIQLVYTVPADSLAELDKPTDGEAVRPGPSADYAERILRGFAITNNGAACLPVLQQHKSINNIRSYQYTVRYACDAEPGLLRIEYRMFIDLSASHENFIDIHVGGVKRDLVLSAQQPGMEIDVTELLATSGLVLPDFLPELSETQPGLRHFLGLGIEHILAGPDHLLFLLLLLLIRMPLRELAILVTLFTLAHSITLIITSLDFVQFDTRWAELLIAISIIAVAAGNVMHLRGHSRPVAAAGSMHAGRRRIVVFLFGLVHGLGFSTVLREIGLPADTLIASLLMFNLGIESGQLLFIGLILPGMVWVWKRFSYPGFSTGLSAIAGMAGVYWLVERL